MRALLFSLYALAMMVLKPLVRGLARLSPKLQAQLEGRDEVGALAKRLAPLRAARRRGVVFFCSSAGEYEQARPLIERLEARGDTYVQVVFFSKSGLDYVTARKDKVNACLAPVGDSAWEWGWLFAALRPEIIAVVRHELWPGFLDAASGYARVHLVAASRSLGETASPLKRAVRTRLLKAFDKIWAVSEEDAAFFRERYGVAADKLAVVGDPKFDRVLERAKARAGDTAKIREALAKTGAFARRLVAGSAHKPDVDALFAARTRLGKALDAWQMLIAPHHVTPEMVGWIHERAKETGLTSVAYSALPQDGTYPVVVLDTMGQLAEAYGAGDAAFVGGALHHQVHNVLEPACRGLALAFGPHYKNSQEAVQLKELGLAAVVEDGPRLATWWAGLEGSLESRAAAVRRAVEAHAGATDRIMSEWQGLLN